MRALPGRFRDIRAMIRLLSPVQRASESSPLIRDLAEAAGFTTEQATKKLKHNG
jgi:hypothetical protein